VLKILFRLWASQSGNYKILTKNILTFFVDNRRN